MVYIQAKEYAWPQERYAGDFELYANNPGQRGDLVLFLKALLDPPAVVIFSGDVHHGSVVDGLYAHGATLAAVYQGKGDWAMRIAQVTSSPIKNVKKDAYDKKRWWTAWQTDAGNVGESIVPQHENRYTTLQDGSALALRADVRTLKGPLGRETYIFENHLCVVDIPETTVGDVRVLFIGEKGGAIATATTSTGFDNRPSSFKPPPPKVVYAPIHRHELEEGDVGEEVPS
jgi:hypothetical protein